MILIVWEVIIFMQAKHIIGELEGFFEGAKTFWPPNCPERSKLRETSLTLTVIGAQYEQAWILVLLDPRMTAVKVNSRSMKKSSFHTWLVRLATPCPISCRWRTVPLFTRLISNMWWAVWYELSYAAFKTHSLRRVLSLHSFSAVDLYPVRFRSLPIF